MKEGFAELLLTVLTLHEKTRLSSPLLDPQTWYADLQMQLEKACQALNEHTERWEK